MRPNKYQKYVPEIDGLRALAVVMVILFHLQPRLFKGGFLGVDIFFVISGFVITNSLLGRFSQGFSARRLLSEFYTRRFRRILPALALCLSVTFIFYLLLAPPYPSKTYIENLLTGVLALLGLSNILLSRQALDYFGSATEYNPFLQTWSLGIEEQFYLIMPISLILIFKWIKYRRASLLNAFVLWLVLGIASLSIFLRSDIFSSQYYALSARGWELAAGVLLSVFIALKGGAGIFSPPLPYRLFDVLVLPILVLSVFFKSKLSIVLVVVLTLFLLAYKPKSYILSSGVMVKIGLASYSIYLWHWPVIWLTRWLGFSTEELLVSSLLLLAILWLGFQSYKYVELPFLDNKDSVPKPRYFFIFLPVGLFSLGISSGLGLLPSVYLGSEKFANVDEIVWYLHDYNKYVSLNRPRVALLGNSHARHILPPLLKNANISNVSLKYREIDTGTISLSNERREANRVLLDIANLKKGDTLILSSYFNSLNLVRGSVDNAALLWWTSFIRRVVNLAEKKHV